MTLIDNRFCSACMEPTQHTDNICVPCSFQKQMEDRRKIDLARDEFMNLDLEDRTEKLYDMFKK